MQLIMKIVIIFAALLHYNVLSSYYEAPTKEKVVIGHHAKNGGRLGGIHPFKIHTVYDVEKSMAKLDILKIKLLQYVVDKALLPFSSLKIKQEPFIFLNYTCDEYWQGGQVRCKSNCAVPKCGTMDIPSTFLGSCTVDNRIEKEERAGINAHFILFVTMDTIPKNCNDDDMFLVAAHCQQGLMDRPVAGYLDVCGKKVVERDLRSRVVNELTHNILHILAFSESLYPFYHDSNGKPRTSRNSDTNLPPMKGSYFTSGHSTIKDVSRNWLTANETVERKVKMLITETVAKVSQEQFGCNDLEGAELEDGAGIPGFAMNHFEKRLFKGEMMTGTHDEEYVFSALTLAVLQDSGWYIVNWTSAQPLAYGQKGGCKFVRTSCLELVQTSCQDCFNPYCDELKDKSLYSQVWNKRCSKDRKSVVTCPTKEYPNELDLTFRYFHLAANKGGLDPLLDYCPIYKEFKWEIWRAWRDSDKMSFCDNVNGEYRREQYWYEVFTENTVCLDFDKPWLRRYCDSHPVPFSDVMFGCYKYKCYKNRLLVGVRKDYENLRKYYHCARKGQLIHIERKDQLVVYSGNIICPDCSELCNDCVSKNFSSVEELKMFEITTGDDHSDLCTMDTASRVASVASVVPAESKEFAIYSNVTFFCTSHT